MSSVPVTPSERGFALGWAVLVVVIAGVFARVRFEPPAVRRDVPAQDFSAVRAFSTLERVLGDGRPHPTGSVANREVRARIEDELRTLGLEPRVDRATRCRGARCAEVENVVVTVPGRGSGGLALLLACHYDSVPTGPGASDDGAGVAALLEVARALTHEGVARDVVLLFDDGEEIGLLGASAFVERAAERARVGAVINVEARGTGGPSLLFETKHIGWRGTRAVARGLGRPVTSSLFAAVYERMPNDTDLTVFGDAGIPGYNFAFLRGVSHYHRATDDLGHLSRQSLQHHGDNVLGLARELARNDGDLDRLAEGPRAVWFDVLSSVVVTWPEPVSVPLALGAALAFGIARRRQRKEALPWLVVALCGVGTALALPGACHLLVAPSVIAAPGVLLSSSSTRSLARLGMALVLAALALATCLFGELAFGLCDVFGV